jgi:ABC-2 type transport system permease protein
MRLLRMIRAEWTKLWSVRSTFTCVLVTVVLTAGITGLLSWAVWAGRAETGGVPAPADLAAVGAVFGQFGLLALAALVITSEFATGSIRGSLAATPSRWRLVVAKAVVVAVVTFASAFVAVVLATMVAAPILGGSASNVLSVGARSASAMTLMGLIVLGIGALLRSTAGTIVTAVAMLFAPMIIGGVVTNRVVRTVLEYLPAGLSNGITTAKDAYTPGVAAALLLAWAVLLLAGGGLALARRDS